MEREAKIKSDQKSSLSASENGMLGSQNTSPVITQTCQQHEGHQLIYMSIDSNQECVFKCMYCISDEDVQQYSLIPIQQVATATNKTIFANFPLTDRDLTKEVKQIALSPPTGDALKLDIEKYFKDLRAKILDRIETIEAKMITKAQSVSDFSAEIVQLYNTMSEKENLKKMIVDEENSFEGKIAAIKELCLNVMNKSSENNQTMKQALQKQKMLQKAIDFSTPNKIKDWLLKQLGHIDMFLIEDMQSFSELLISSKQPSETDSVVEDIMKLVKNKFNDVSEESCVKFEEELNRVRFAISSLEIPAAGPTYASLEKLNERQANIIRDLIRDIADLSDKQEANTYQPENGQEIIKIIGNQTNFCSQDYLEDVNKAVKSVSEVLALFAIRKSNPKTKEQKALNALKIPQLLNLAYLAQKINQLTIEKGDQFTLSTSPQQEIQENSEKINSIIQRNMIRTNQKKIADQLLVDFPIFELLPQIIQEESLAISFSKTKYQQSQEMELKQVGSYFQLSLPSGKRGQAASDIVNNNLTYSLKLKFNRPLGELTGGEFLIGLVLNFKIDTDYLDSYSGFKTNGTGPQILKKGSLLDRDPVRKSITSLEFRWCVSKQLFFVADQNNSNINQADKKYFKPLEKYNFCIYFHSVNDNNWNVTVTDFKEIDPSMVDRFN